MTRFFYDEITDDIIDMAEVKNLYSESDTDMDFSEWFQAVQSYNNGCLTEVFLFSVSAYDSETEQIITFQEYGHNAKDASDRYSIKNDMYIYLDVISSSVLRV